MRLGLSKDFPCTPMVSAARAILLTGAWSGYGLDQPDELFAPVAVLALELHQVVDLLLQSPAVGGPVEAPVAVPVLQREHGRPQR